MSVPSSELGPPPPLRKRECLSPLRSWREPHSVPGEGVGGPNSDEGTETLVLYVLYTIIPFDIMYMI